jgi:anaerobic magnesium-protoporphyrin IX monomethyl ester cyclase
MRHSQPLAIMAGLSSNMKILLVNPATRIWTTRNTIPLGLAYLAAVLEREDHKVRILDLAVEARSDDELRKEIASMDMVGVTATTPAVYNAYEICRIARKEDVPVVMGGPHPSALPYESLEECDAIVSGEGEETIVHVCNAVEKGSSMREIRGILYKDDGRIVDNRPRGFIKDLDSIPFPALHLFPDAAKYTVQHPLLDKKVASGVILTSRGCPFNCVFCYKAIFGSVYRYRSPQNVLAEWRMLVEERGAKEMGIIDDSFTSNPKRAIEICKMIVNEKLQVPWVMPTGTRITPVSKELLEWMKKSGCTRIAFGIESGSQEVLDKVGKGITLQDVEHAVNLTKEVGLGAIGLFMIGNYCEDESSIKQTIAFSKRLNLDYAIFYIATPFPGTRLFEIIRNEGRFLITNWDEYVIHGNHKAFFEIGEVTRELVERMHKKAYREYYLNPKFIGRTLSNRSTLLNAHNYIKAFLKYLA